MPTSLPRSYVPSLRRRSYFQGASEFYCLALPPLSALLLTVAVFGHQHRSFSETALAINDQLNSAGCDEYYICRSADPARTHIRHFSHRKSALGRLVHLG